MRERGRKEGREKEGRVGLRADGAVPSVFRLFALNYSDVVSF